MSGCHNPNYTRDCLDILNDRIDKLEQALNFLYNQVNLDLPSVKQLNSIVKSELERISKHQHLESVLRERNETIKKMQLVIDNAEVRAKDFRKLQNDLNAAIENDRASRLNLKRLKDMHDIAVKSAQATIVKLEEESKKFREAAQFWFNTADQLKIKYEGKA